MDDLKFKVLLNDKTEKEFFILHTFKDNDLNVVIYTDDSSNYYANYYEIDNKVMNLDKDILIKGNKIYSPKTCIFVPHDINKLFTKSNKTRGEYPIGVSKSKTYGKVRARCSVNGKTKELGEYYSIEEAFQVYKKFKESYIKQIADEYKPYIPKELYEAMYRYEVEITD